MLKTSFRYNHTSVRLEIEGFPDTSLGHIDGQIGIISSWKLELLGSADLEGKLEHLQEMMIRVLPYARYLLSGVKRTFGDNQSTVQISSYGHTHQLLLRSSQPGIDPLMIELDDAELSDLVRCLDELRIDTRVRVDWDLPAHIPLTRNELVNRVPFLQRFGAPFLGGTTFVVVAFITLLLSVDMRKNEQYLEETTSTDTTRGEVLASRDKISNKTV